MRNFYFLALTIVVYTRLELGSTTDAGALLLFGLASDTEPTWTYREDTTAILHDVEAASIFGIHTWRLSISGEVANIRVSSHSKVYLGQVWVTGVTKEAEECVNRLQISTVPDSGFSAINPLSGYSPRMARPISGTSGYVCYIPCWVAVDMGFRLWLYKLGTYGGWKPGTYFAVYTYQFSYRLVDTDFATYQEDNATKIFSSHSSVLNWNIESFNLLLYPVDGQIFRFEPLTSSSSSEAAIRFELYGCAVGPLVSITRKKMSEATFLQKAPEVVDDDTTSCVTIATNKDAIFMTHIQNTNSSSVSVKTLSVLDESCSVDTQHGMMALVKAHPPLRAVYGGFKKCPILSQYTESTLVAHEFNCTCYYGVCEGFHIRVFSGCTVHLCSVALNQTAIVQP